MTKTICYLRGDATQPIGEGPKVLVHICNDIGGWGRGFVLALSARWKEPEAAYRRWAKEKTPQFTLGEVQFVEVEPELWVANLFGQSRIRRERGRPPIRYRAIREGMERVASFAQENGASVHMPRIGCGLAGGSWDQIEPILAETLLKKEISVTVYDF